MKRSILIVLILIYTEVSFSQELVAQFNKTVTFIYVAGANKFVPQGTGFLVSVPSKTPGANYIYLVTAKHVLYTPEMKPLNVIFARFNTKDSSEMFNVPLYWNGSNKTVYLHSDPSIDLAIIPIVVPSNLDFRHIGVNQIIKRKDFDSLKVNVGTEVFFTGLFTSYMGTRKINPIFRFGRICLLPEDRIRFDEVERNLLLIESSSYGGNSGSPVIFQYNKGNRTFVSLGGVVLGSFNQGQILGKADDKNVIAWSSLGISAVTPSEYILDILNYPELESLRSQ